MQSDTPTVDQSFSHHVTGNPARLLTRSFPLRILVLLILHILLGLVVRQIAPVATVHALATFLAALYFLRTDRQPDRLILAIAYLVASEVIWRMSGAVIFWEFGKYALSFLLILALLKYQRLSVAAKWPAVFFILLLPSLALLTRFDREVISFNLSGPFSLAIAVTFFSTVTLERRQVKRLLLALFVPVVTVAFIATYGTLTAGDIFFGRSSLAITSGGYGPNQVSSVLGLGALAGLLYAFIEERHLILRLLLVLASLWMLAQAALTFSRGGMLTTVATILVAAIFFLRDRRSRLAFIGSAALLFLLWSYLVFPALDQYTGGALSVRITDTNLTGRDKIIQADLLAFRENPLAGVGLGQSRFYHAVLFRESSAHTEFTRWLAEHGTFGLLALLLFSWEVVRRLFQDGTPLVRGLTLAFTVWALLFMSHAAMRLAAPSLVFALASATFWLNDFNKPHMQAKIREGEFQVHA